MKVPEEQLRLAEKIQNEIDELEAEIRRWERDKFVNGNEYRQLQNIYKNISELQERYQKIEIVDFTDKVAEKNARQEIKSDQTLLNHAKNSYGKLRNDFEHRKQTRPRLGEIK